MADRSIFKRLFYTTAGLRWISARVETGLAPSCLRRNVLRRLILEWVQNPHIQLPKILFVPGRNNQTMDPRRSGNHGVL